jgi:hypothetical protein
VQWAEPASATSNAVLKTNTTPLKPPQPKPKPNQSDLIPADKLVTEAFCNSPPHFLLRSGTTRGNHKPFRNNLARKDVPAFADALLSALEHFRTGHGLHFTSLSPFNEPGSPAWIAPIAVQEGCYFSHGRMNDVRARFFKDSLCVCCRSFGV